MTRLYLSVVACLVVVAWLAFMHVAEVVQQRHAIQIRTVEKL